MRITPKIVITIKNDIGVFMCTIPPVLFALLSTFLFLKSELHKDQFTLIETIYISTIIFTSLSVFLWPFVIWWWRTINSTFVNGVEIIANGNKINSKYMLGLGIKYSFQYEGKTINHTASLVSNKNTKKIAKNKSFTVFYNPVKNISFIKDAYI